MLTHVYLHVSVLYFLPPTHMPILPQKKEKPKIIRVEEEKKNVEKVRSADLV
jgi:hypothetical protein